MRGDRWWSRSCSDIIRVSEKPPGVISGYPELGIEAAKLSGSQQSFAALGCYVGRNIEEEAKDDKFDGDGINSKRLPRIAHADGLGSQY